MSGYLRPGPLGDAVRQAVAVIEREMILRTLEQQHWHRVRVARLLGVSYKTLLQKIKHYELESEPPPASPTPSVDACPFRGWWQGIRYPCAHIEPHRVHAALVDDRLVTIREEP